jgi:hypothetical protein
VLGGLCNVTPIAATRLNDNNQTLDSNCGAWTQIANSFNLNVAARMRNRAHVAGRVQHGEVEQRLL